MSSLLADDVVRPVLLVGSFPYSTAGETLAVSGPALRGVVQRLTDGEPQGWTTFPGKFMGEVDALEPDEDFTQLINRRIPHYRVKKGYTSQQIHFKPAGYAEIVRNSYAIFRQLKQDGKIAEGVRFQQSLPTPFGVMAQYIRKDIETVLPSYEKTLFGELRQICSIVPLHELAIQWDIAVEVVGGLERHFPDLLDRFPMEQLAAFTARAADQVPEPAEMGLHFCYGNPGGKHIIEPRDLGTVVPFCNEIVSRIRRDVTWVHMPVPIERDDKPYFATLADLRLPPKTEFYLGLVHLRDGLTGGRRRIEAAKNFRKDFGVATECGFRYATPDSVPALLELHQQLARVS